jgi:hypothetical protein
VTATRECEHGLPPGCPLHSRRPLACRVFDWSVLAALVGLDLGVFALGITWGWRLIHAAATALGWRS